MRALLVVALIGTALSGVLGQYGFALAPAPVMAPPSPPPPPPQPIAAPSYAQQQPPGPAPLGEAPPPAQCPGISFTQVLSTTDQTNYRIIFNGNVEANMLMWVDVHWRLNGGELQNFRMTKTGPTSFEQAGIVVNPGDVLQYFFTYCVNLNGPLDCNTDMFQFTREQPQPLMQQPIVQNVQPVQAIQSYSQPLQQQSQSYPPTPAPLSTPAYGAQQPLTAPQPYAPAPAPLSTPAYGAQQPLAAPVPPPVPAAPATVLLPVGGKHGGFGFGGGHGGGFGGGFGGPFGGFGGGGHGHGGGPSPIIAVPATFAAPAPIAQAPTAIIRAMPVVVVGGDKHGGFGGFGGGHGGGFGFPFGGHGGGIGGTLGLLPVPFPQPPIPAPIPPPLPPVTGGAPY